jgi:outer membrane receptor protein involved in Fe transport
MKRIAALCGGVSLLAVAPAAFAQDAAPAAPAQPPATQPSALDTVVVTGSRIVRNGYAAPTPVTVAPAAELKALTPTTIPDALNKLPQFAGSTGAAAGATSNGVPGNYLNLRDFGINRTLILMNGLRVAPTNFNGQVDVNAIPQMLLQRVDVVTGGASAVYGSDAVTGVVNFIIDNHFNGLEGQAQTGISGQGDARSSRYGVAAGSKVLDHGHVEASFEHFDQAGLNATDRPFSSARNVYTGAGTAASPYALTSNAGLANTAFGGYVVSGPFARQQFLSNGQLGPYTPGAASGTSTIVTGGDAAYYNNETLTAPQNLNQAFARFDYDFTDHISGFVQGTNTWTISHQVNSNWPPQLLTFFSGNPFLPSSAQAQLAPGQSFTANIFPRDLELLSQQTQSTAANSVTAGLNGGFGNFTWNAGYTHGVSIYRQSLSNNINVPNFLAATDAVSGPNGPQCYVSTTPNASKYPGCAPIDVFGVGNESPAALAYVFNTTSFRVVNFFDDYSASISGNAFNTWAGPVSVAANAEYRQQELKETTNADPTTPVTNVTGVLRDIPINSVTNRPTPPSSVYAYATVAPSDASYAVWEVSGETVAPLAKDVPWIKSLNVSGAVRYTDYSTSGSVVTWKAGLDYQPVSDIRFRATESQDIRAPTLYDLYAGQSVLVQNLNDQYNSKVNQVVFITTRGNPNLTPEKSLTTTAGIVYSPHWLPRFRVSVDYYNISMDNAIATLSGNNATILQQCAAQPNAPLCTQLIVRGNGQSAFPTAVYSEPFNVAKTWTNGVDVETSYDAKLQDWVKTLRGNLGLRLLYSFQPTLNSINFPGAPVVNSAGTVGGVTGPGVATNRVTLMANYGLGPLTANWQTRWSSPLSRGTPGQYFAQGALPAYSVSDLNVNYRLVVEGRMLNLFFNMQNVFDAQPRISPSLTFSGIPGFGSSAVAGDDLVGRNFTVGLRFRY